MQIRERQDYKNLKNLLENKNLIKVASIAPAVRVALGEEFKLEIGENVEGKIVGALKELGFDYVFDITFGADLTIMEEAMELLNRIKNGGTLPMFTSCCPAWVKYVEIFYPNLINNLSSCKSPISMQGAIIKTYFASEKKIMPEEIANVVIAPCTAKKAEIKRKEISVTSRDTDYALTTRELASLIRENNIDFKNVLPAEFDSPLGKGSSAGLIFGNTGGVCEAALRTAYFFLTGKNLDTLEFNSIRGNSDIKECEVDFDGQKISVAVANGMKNAKMIIDQILSGEKKYHFVEVMNCKGGCIAGGGQPKITLLNMEKTKGKRLSSIYQQDQKSSLRLCHSNPDIIYIYKNFLGAPNSEKAEELLHTRYFDKSYLLKRGAK